MNNNNDTNLRNDHRHSRRQREDYEDTAAAILSFVNFSSLITSTKTSSTSNTSHKITISNIRLGNAPNSVQRLGFRAVVIRRHGSSASLCLFTLGVLAHPHIPDPSHFGGARSPRWSKGLPTLGPPLLPLLASGLHLGILFCIVPPALLSWLTSACSTTGVVVSLFLQVLFSPRCLRPSGKSSWLAFLFMHRPGAWKPVLCLAFVGVDLLWLGSNDDYQAAFPPWHRRRRRVRSRIRKASRLRPLAPWEVSLLRLHHGSMPPPSARQSAQGPRQGRSDCRRVTERSSAFWVSSSVGRSTSGYCVALYCRPLQDPVAVAADQSVQQLAQSQANALDKLGKRINGNLKAKVSLQEAATAWMGKIGQHLAALTTRLSAVAARLDQDQAEAISALQQASVHLEASAQEQVDKALRGMGPVWTQAQEAEVLRLAACLRAFSAVGGGDTTATGQVSVGDAGVSGASNLMASGSAMAPSFPGGSDGPSFSTPARSSTSGEAMDVSNQDPSAKRRWNQRGNRHPRPAKSPRRELDLSAEPWPRLATGSRPIDHSGRDSPRTRRSLYQQWRHLHTHGLLLGIILPDSARNLEQNLWALLPLRSRRSKHFLCFILQRIQLLWLQKAKGSGGPCSSLSSSWSPKRLRDLLWSSSFCGWELCEKDPWLFRC